MTTPAQQRGYYVWIAYGLVVFATLAVVKATASTTFFLVALLVVPALWAIVFGAALGLIDRVMGDDEENE